MSTAVPPPPPPPPPGAAAAIGSAPLPPPPPPPGMTAELDAPPPPPPPQTIVVEEPSFEVSGAELAGEPVVVQRDDSSEEEVEPDEAEAEEDEAEAYEGEYADEEGEEGDEEESEEVEGDYEGGEAEATDEEAEEGGLVEDDEEEELLSEPASPKAGAKGAAPTMQGTRTVDNPEGEEEVLVKTEFVWADGAEKDVKLAGSWNGWMPIQMYHEGGGMWSVVTPVPAGTHEFKFIVDGEWKHSTRHPTVGDDEENMNNIRVIRGPPQAYLQQQQQQAQDEAQQRKKRGCCTIS
mmetsp:Transcript_6011/g.18111  ORF Transcript_6011/g.18111 Transcript_6011/m.18111 type:complete len:292 (-) Transcript_6011:439-1314(-)